MKKVIISLLILASLSAFVYSVNSKPVSGIEICIKTSKGEIVKSAKTDKKGAFKIKIKDKGNYTLNISSGEILKGIANMDKDNLSEVSYIVTLAVEAESNNWTVDTENNVTHTQKTEKDAYIEFTQTLTIGSANSITNWTESMINIVSKGNGEIRGNVTIQKVK